MGRAKTVKIYCSTCKTLLYHYQKRGNGHLVKCFRERILKDFTEEPLTCPGCGQEFAREALIRGKPAHKIIQGKVFHKR
ncbi:MAG: hypothetical protein EP343_11300 [Deltaproteobacteria bacterium]|nr:MAG: hypothetical protein EP343_11300 [Deltaproteobacteria bacterium]